MQTHKFKTLKVLGAAIDPMPRDLRLMVSTGEDYLNFAPEERLR